MDLKIVLREIESPALQEIVKAIWNTVERVQEKEIIHQQGAVEIAGHKHTIQAIALDWTFGAKKNIKRLPKKIK